MADFDLRGLERVSHYISLQGSIGAGKSTLLAGVRRYLEQEHLCADNPAHLAEGHSDYFVVVDEPLAEWLEKRYAGGTLSILDAFYRDPQAMGFPFQIMAFTSRLRALRDALRRVGATDARIHVLSERSMRADALFFAAVCDGAPEHEIAWDVYNQFFHLVCDCVLAREDMMIYIPASPDLCLARIEKRARAEETTNAIPLSYLARLAAKHDDMVAAFRAEGKQVIDLDGFAQNLSAEEIDAFARRLMIEIREAIAQ